MFSLVSVTLFTRRGVCLVHALSEQVLPRGGGGFGTLCPTPVQVLSVGRKGKGRGGYPNQVTHHLPIPWTGLVWG